MSAWIAIASIQPFKALAQLPPKLTTELWFDGEFHTDDGATYYEACARVLSDIEEADATVSAGRVEPRGPLRVALPASFGHQHIAPLIPRFAERYPQIHLALSLSDRNVNLLELLHHRVFEREPEPAPGQPAPAAAGFRPACIALSDSRHPAASCRGIPSTNRRYRRG